MHRSKDIQDAAFVAASDSLGAVKRYIGPPFSASRRHGAEAPPTTAPFAKFLDEISDYATK